MPVVGESVHFGYGGDALEGGSHRVLEAAGDPKTASLVPGHRLLQVRLGSAQ